MRTTLAFLIVIAFGRMYSGGDSCASGNADPIHGNTHPANHNPYEHARANSYANA